VGGKLGGKLGRIVVWRIGQLDKLVNWLAFQLIN
jgi:hypothetical protein